jgi:hypothetical protein
MAWKDELKNILKEAGQGFLKQAEFNAFVQQGREQTKHLINYREERARARIDELVEASLGQPTQPILLGVLFEFTEQIQNTKDRKFQYTSNDLLWYFKEKIFLQPELAPNASR